MVDTEDPLCAAAQLFSMEDFTIIALTEQKLFHRLLEKSCQADPEADGSGRAFVLMPSASPYGRILTSQLIRNYETMLRLAVA